MDILDLIYELRHDWAKEHGGKSPNGICLNHKAYYEAMSSPKALSAIETPIRDGVTKPRIFNMTPVVDEKFTSIEFF